MLITALALLSLLIVLLAIPISLVYRVSWRGRFQGNVHLYWLFGMIHIHIPATAKPATTKATKPRTKPARRRKPRTRQKTNPLAAWRLRPFRQRIMKFLHDLWHAIHKRDVRLRLLIGLGDPADTGQLWAVMGPVSALLAQSREVQIDIEPDFTESSLEFSSHGNIQVIPMQLLALTLALLLSPAFWYGMQQMRKAH